MSDCLSFVAMENRTNTDVVALQIPKIVFHILLILSPLRKVFKQKFKINIKYFVYIENILICFAPVIRPLIGVYSLVLIVFSWVTRRNSMKLTMVGTTGFVVKL
jgi:hypothetical protein